MKVRITVEKELKEFYFRILKDSTIYKAVERDNYILISWISDDNPEKACSKRYPKPLVRQYLSDGTWEVIQ